jgi:hypothetical protein
MMPIRNGIPPGGKCLELMPDARSPDRRYATYELAVDQRNAGMRETDSAGDKNTDGDV